MTQFIESVQQLLAEKRVGSGNEVNAPPLIVHADVFRARAAIANTRDPKLMLERHMEVLQSISGKRPLFLPVFNYDYTRSRVYLPASAPSQVGVLNEYARTNMAGGRCGAPVFNFFTNAPAIAASVPCAGLVDPFGPDTVFGLVHRARGQVLMYGAPFASFTALHYIERLSGGQADGAGGPLYRYDKVFSGIVQALDGSTTPVDLNYHCRPMGKALEYDWPRLRQEAQAQGVLRSVKVPGSTVLLLDLGQIVEFWLAQLQRDPLYLLDADSRAWVGPELDRLGRRFIINDFEDAS